MKRIALAACLALLPLSAAADAIAQLRTDLLGRSSATQVLTKWCAARHFASPAVIRAIRVRKFEKPAGHAVRVLLKAHAREPIRYRRVRLVCGAHVLSEADNWYRPSQLTPAMNRALETTDTPFGAVVRPLNFHRNTLDAEDLSGANAVLRVRAVLVGANGTPFSVVVETYRKDLVGKN